MIFFHFSRFHGFFHYGEISKNENFLNMATSARFCSVELLWGSFSKNAHESPESKNLTLSFPNILFQSETVDSNALNENHRRLLRQKRTFLAYKGQKEQSNRNQKDGWAPQDFHAKVKEFAKFQFFFSRLSVLSRKIHD